MPLSDFVVTRLELLAAEADHRAAVASKARAETQNHTTASAYRRKADSEHQIAREFRTLAKYASNPNTPAPKGG